MWHNCSKCQHLVGHSEDCGGGGWFSRHRHPLLLCAQKLENNYLFVDFERKRFLADLWQSPHGKVSHAPASAFTRSRPWPGCWCLSRQRVQQSSNFDWRRTRSYSVRIWLQFLFCEGVYINRRSATPWNFVQPTTTHHPQPSIIAYTFTDQIISPFIAR